MRKRILLIHRYFWPDTPPYASMLRYIAAYLAKQHDVTVLSTQPSYKSDVAIEKQPAKDLMDGFSVQRISVPKENRSSILSRLLSTSVYLARIFIRIVRFRPGVVMVSTAPAVLSGYVVQLASRLSGSKFYYHCQDIHPEIAHLSGQVKSGLVRRILLRMDNASCSKADKIIVISEDMRQSLMDRGIAREKIHVISNFALEPESGSLYEATPITLGGDSFNILFAGNVGRFQALDSLLDLATALRSEDKIRFHIMGSGIYLDTVKRRVAENGLENVFFIPHQSIAHARELMQQAQLCVVSLNKEIYKYAYPSKTLTYLAEGKPLLCIVEQDSQLAKIVEEHRLGLVCTQDSVEEVTDKIRKLSADKIIYDQMSQNARTYYSDYLLKEKILANWDQLFEA